MVRFAALRFTEDENIRARVYWYRCACETKAGERVLAPVGSHDRLQCARVERVLFAEEGDAPYDPALLKDVAAPLGARSFLWEGRTCFELGGVRYDQKRFTRFRVFACLFGEPPAFAPAGQKPHFQTRFCFPSNENPEKQHPYCGAASRFPLWTTE